MSATSMRRMILAAFIALAPCATHAQAAPESVPSIFAALTADREHIYAGEVFYVTLSIFSTNPNLSDEFQLTGLSGHPDIAFEAFGELAPATQKHSGVTYEVQRFKCRALAKSAKAIAISPKLSGAVITTIKRDFFFGIQRVRTSVVIPLNPLKLVIHPLPDSGKPKHCSGLIGQISYDVKIADQDIAIGDLVRIVTTISGDANLTDATATAASAAPGLRVYEVKPLADQSTAKKVFEQTVVPLSTNVTQLAPVSFSYFDPRARSYRTVTRGPFKLSVRKQDPSRTNEPPTHGSSSTPPDEEIRGLKDAPSEWRTAAARPWYATNAFMVAQLVPPIVLIALMFCVRHSRRSESRNALKKDRAAALASARKLLEKAKLSLEKGDVAACADQIWQSVSGYFCATFDLAPGEFNAERVSDLVTDAGLSAENTSSLRETMQTCERLRFGGAAALDGRESDGAGLATAISNIDALMKELDKKL